MPDQWDDWMPAPCSECGGIWDLDAMYPDPRCRGQRSIPVVCPDCYRELEADDDH